MKKLVRLLTLAAVVAAVIAWLQRRPAPPSASPTAPPTPPAPRPDPAPAPVVPTEEVAPEPAADPWLAPGDDGSCPGGYPVKAKASSKIFHVPGGALYDRMVPDRCYATPEAAEADGFRQSLR